MNFKDIFSDIPILIVLLTFLLSICYCIFQYLNVNKNLKAINKFISGFKRTDLNFRFKEMDTWMLSNPYIASIWIEFKNTLVFSESVALKDGNDYQYQEVSSTVQNVQTTVDPLYFFDEEALVFEDSYYSLLFSFGELLYNYFIIMFPKMSMIIYYISKTFFLFSDS